MKKTALTCLALFAAAITQAQITLGQVDDFQDGTLQNWGGGDILQNVPNGGPGGAGDRFLSAESVGGGGAGSRLAIFNDLQWTGDWQAAGVNGVTVYMKNFGQTDLSMRLVLFDFTGTASRWTSTVANILPAGSDWTPMTFSVREQDLTLVFGTSTYQEVITSVNRLMFRHQVGPPDDRGDSIVALAGFDNITAVPEPATVAALSLGLVALFRRRRR